MRPYTSRTTPPFTMIGSSVAEVEESRHPDFPVGTTIVLMAGWVERGIVDPDKMNKDSPGGTLGGVMPVPDQYPTGLSKSLLIGTVGMPGNTAYFGLLDICKPQPGETVLVSGAAGAVGSLVGQIAKIRGCRVVGVAGSQDKCHFLTSQLGFDAAINYNKGNVKTAVRRAAPAGVDCYFDNVGGNISQAVLLNMNTYGRVAVCGAITGYNDTQQSLYPALQPTFVAFQLKMEGFVVWRWLHSGRWDEGLGQMADWLREDKIKNNETFVDGFENLPTAFIGMLAGDNLGKMIA